MGGGRFGADLYAGVGLFSIALARRFDKVTAVESGTSATEDLKFNAERAGVTLTPVKRSVEDYLAGRLRRPILCWPILLGRDWESGR